MAEILGKSRDFVVAYPELRLTKNQQKAYEKMAKRLENGEPLAYILGHKEFFGLDFEVDKNTLIPRPETELLVEEALNLLQNSNQNLVIDVGTGSGCILISILKTLHSSNHNSHQSALKCLAMDKSKKALEIAKKNAKKHGVEKQIKFTQSDLLGFLKEKNNSSIVNRQSQIVIIANLPYLSEKIYNQTEKSVKDFEPKSALLSGKDGLDHYQRLFSQINRLKQKNPSTKWTIIFEISPEQKKIIEKEFPKKFSLQKISFKKDLAGKWRMAFCY